MNRDLYGRYVIDTKFPEWPCPNCRSGRLVLLTDTFNQTQRVDFDSNDPDFEPGWIEYLFTAHFSCTNEICSGKVVCSGSGGVDQFTDQMTGESDWENYLCPKHFEPPLHIFFISETVPRAVSESLRDSFSLYFVSPQAALTKLRVTVETLLEELGVPAVSDKGKPLYLSAVTGHSRPSLLQDVKSRRQAPRASARRHGALSTALV